MFGVLIDLTYFCVMIPQYRIKFKNLEEYHIIINVLFSIGYSWITTGKTPKYLDAPQIDVWDDYFLSFRSKIGESIRNFYF